MKDFLELGKIVKPQGVKGEVKVAVSGDAFSRIKNVKSVFIDNKEYGVIGKKSVDNSVILSLFGVSDRDSAEFLRGKYVFVKKDELKPLNKNEFYVADLIGVDLYLSDKKIGTITDVVSLKTDVIYAKTDDKKAFCFPFVKKLNPKLDLSTNKLIIDEDALKEIVLYED
ncbi:MAG: 16S rRNA processing protein RimM [Clostridia bacterium]|nr:16S rRNA processing protein RimM [Clostridia bacterium]